VADYLVVPSTAGVDYLLEGQVVNGQTITGPASGTLTAAAQQGFELTDPDWSFDFDLAAATPCPGQVIPVAPAVVQSTTCNVQGTVTFPTTAGLRYLLNGTDVSGQDLTGPISGTVVVEVLPGYVLAPGALTEFTFAVAAAEVCDEVLGEDIEPVDELPFTGVDTEALVAAGTLLLGAGWALVRKTRRWEEG
jgi:serine protease